MKLPLVQILVVVANTQMRSLRTEARKVSTRTAIGCGLVGSKWHRNCDKRCEMALDSSSA